MSETLRYQVEIKAPRDRVWEQMLSDAGYRQWTAAFHAGSHFKGEWTTGSDMLFLGPDGGGMRARIEKAERPSHVSIQHLGEMSDGKPTSSDDWTEAFERYWLTEPSTGTTHLRVELTGVPPQYVEMMNKMWPDALALLKSASEA